MQPVAFCNRCRGMKVGLNLRYILHCVNCKEWTSKSYKILILMVLYAVVFFASPTPIAFVLTDLNTGQEIQKASLIISPTITIPSPAVAALSSFLTRYKIDSQHRDRVAEAIVVSGRKYNLDPRLVASIMIVESRANPFAISASDAIGIMQIHLPTWGQTADKEGINLFKIEDNVDFGARILKDYVRQHGLWEGVRRYKGWNSESPQSTQSAEDYVQKVQRIYSYQKAHAAEALQ